MKITTLCGSNRQESSNHSILRAAQRYFDGHVFTNLDLSILPFFDPDNQYGENVPPQVLAMREAVANCDLLIISTPEYAHGIPGILKNGLEWIFCAETGKKPVAVIIGAAQGQWARDQLIEVLTTMDFSININQAFIINGARVKIDTNGEFLDNEMKNAFLQFLEQFKN